MPMGTDPPLWSRRQWLQTASASALGALSLQPSAAVAVRPERVEGLRQAQGERTSSHHQNDATGATHAPRVLTAWNQGHQSWAGLWALGQASSSKVAPRGITLPARAHQLLLLPPTGKHHASHSPQALVLARRPGEYLLRMDVLQTQALQWHRMEDDRYLGGHAALSGNGSTFFTTETDGDTGQGLIAERSVQTLHKLHEFSSGGIGPHAVLWSAAGSTAQGSLLVANGGILNLPETGRRKRNLGHMDSNLTRLDAATGAVLAQYRLVDPFISLRHLAVAPDGTVGIALQAEHPDVSARQAAPALALLQGEQLRAVDWPPSPPHAPTVEQQSTGWDGYAGDVCFAAGRFWVSAPQAGWVASWSAQGTNLQTQALPGAAALAATPDGWMAGGSTAALGYLTTTARPQRYALPVAWDNHASLLYF
jgi:uncharacterized protein